MLEEYNVILYSVIQSGQQHGCSHADPRGVYCIGLFQVFFFLRFSGKGLYVAIVCDILKFILYA